MIAHMSWALAQRRKRRVARGAKRTRACSFTSVPCGSLSRQTLSARQRRVGSPLVVIASLRVLLAHDRQRVPQRSCEVVSRASRRSFVARWCRRPRTSARLRKGWVRRISFWLTCSWCGRIVGRFGTKRCQRPPGLPDSDHRCGSWCRAQPAQGGHTHTPRSPSMRSASGPGRATMLSPWLSPARLPPTWAMPRRL